MPPMMTMTNVSITAFGAMPSDAVTKGAASTPPMPARPQPIPNTAERTSAHVGAKRMHHLGVLRGGADQQTEPRAFQELPDGDRDDDAGAGEEQPVDRERFIQDEHDAGQRLSGGAPAVPRRPRPGG